MPKRPDMQVAVIADNGVTIRPLALALQAGTRVLVATLKALAECSDEELVFCEGCEKVVPLSQAHSWGADGGYGCEKCTAEMVWHAEGE